MGAEILGHSGAAPTVMAKHEKLSVTRQRVERPGDLAHRQQAAARDPADRVFLGLADVDQRRLAAI